MRLAELQKVLQGYILESSAEVLEAIAVPKEQSINFAERRLLIYQRSYQNRLLELLMSDYPGMCFILGGKSEWFFLEYLKKQPPTTFNPLFIGKQLSQFISTHPIYSDNVFLIEMCVLECAAIRSLHAQNLNPLTMQQLQQFSEATWPSRIFRLHPSVQLLEFRTSVKEVWDALKSGQNPIPDPTLLEATSQTLLWRKNYQIQLKSLNTEAVLFYQCVQKSLNFSEMCDVFCENFSEAAAAETIIGLIVAALNEGVLIDF